MLKKFIFLTLLFCSLGTLAQEFPLDYQFGEKYNDRYRYSNLLFLHESSSGEKTLVRAYYTGLILRPKGYIIERYDAELNLLDEYNYKFREGEFVEAFETNGQLYLLFLKYNLEKEAYEYEVHKSPLSTLDFKRETLLSIYTQPVEEALDKNYYNRNFNRGFTTTVLTDPSKRAFAISTHYKKGKVNKHMIYVYSAGLQKLMEVDFSDEVEEKNYAFEEMEVSPGMDQVFLMGKAYFKKRRFKAEERKFQYELVALKNGQARTQTFDVPGKYSEALKPVWRPNGLVCMGFYADRKDNRYNGIEYFVVDPASLAVISRKYNPFSDQFMFDKFGKSDDKEIKNLVFKNVFFDASGSVVFNAEEYFVSSSIQANASGGRVKVQRYHHNDIISAKLDKTGSLLWARNINKTEVTQGDGAYASYSSYTRDGNTYFFICTAAENPQLLNNERLIFRQGLSRNRNVFVIALDDQGKMNFKKIIDDKEARLPLMVSKPLIDKKAHQLLFYAKRGTKKQLVSVQVKG